MNIVYSYSKCTTCKKALYFLNAHKISFTHKEITTAPSLLELETMLKYYDGNIKKLFNISGQLYRELNLSEKLPHMSSEQALKLLNENGMLVKRPFFLGEDFGLVGFKEDEWIFKNKVNLSFL